MKTRPWIIVFRKEMLDALRDRRSLFSASLFCWLGPLLVGLVWREHEAPALLPAFLLVTAFTGAMNIANDAIAGERERGSLEPLLMNPVSRRHLALGKWLAVCVFSLGCVMLTLLCALVVLYVTPLGARVHPDALIRMLAVAAPLVPFAAGLSLLACTFARSSKEGNSYLSVLLLAPMLTGVLAEFFPVRLETAVALVPVLGQQRMVSSLAAGQTPAALWMFSSAICPLLLGAAAVAAVARLLRRERIIFGR